MKKLILLIFVVAASLNAQAVQGQIGQVPVVAAADNSPVGGAGNLTTVGSVPYVSASGILNQDAGQFFWDATNNRLGIGTATPATSLQVAGGKILLDNAQAIQFKDSSGTARTILQVDSGDNVYLDSAAAGGDTFFRALGVDRMTIKGTSGRVGIGTTAPGYLLDVAKSSGSGTFRVYDQAATGSTLAVFRAGVAQSGNVLEVQNNAGANVLSVSATGSLTSAVSITAGGNITAGTTQDVGWSARSTMTSPSGGVITLYNNAQTDFNRLQFGGTTSSFPSIQRSTTKLFFRLADDSAGATVRAGGYESSDGTAGATVTTCTGFKNGLCISGT